MFDSMQDRDGEGLFPPENKETVADPVPDGSNGSGSEGISEEIRAVTASGIDIRERGTGPRTGHEPVVGAGGPVEEEHYGGADSQKEYGF